MRQSGPIARRHKPHVFVANGRFGVQFWDAFYGHGPCMTITEFPTWTAAVRHAVAIAGPAYERCRSHERAFAELMVQAN